MRSALSPFICQRHLRLLQAFLRAIQRGEDLGGAQPLLHGLRLVTQLLLNSLRKAAAEPSTWRLLVARVEAACRVLIQVARRLGRGEAMEGRLACGTPWIRRGQRKVVSLLRSMSEVEYLVC